MAGFGHVMKIFIDVGFPCVGFPGYIVCLYVVACFNVYFSLIIARYNPNNHYHKQPHIDTQYTLETPCELVTAHLQASIQWSLLKPYKGLITCNTIGQYYGLQQTMCPNHVQDLNHL